MPSPALIIRTKIGVILLPPFTYGMPLISEKAFVADFKIDGRAVGKTTP